jgi:hypothetical protein
MTWLSRHTSSSSRFTYTHTLLNYKNNNEFRNRNPYCVRFLPLGSFQQRQKQQAFPSLLSSSTYTWGPAIIHTLPKISAPNSASSVPNRLHPLSSSRSRAREARAGHETASGPRRLPAPALDSRRQLNQAVGKNLHLPENIGCSNRTPGAINSHWELPSRSTPPRPGVRNRRR